MGELPPISAKSAPLPEGCHSRGYLGLLLRSSISFRLASIAIVFCVCLSIALPVKMPAGYPYTLSVFFGTLMLIVVVCEKSSLGVLAASWLTRFADFLERRGSFRSNAEIEAPKFALIRFLFGCLMIHRAVLIIIFLLPDDWNDPLLVTLTVLNLFAAVMVTAGFFTQAAFAFLILVQWQISDGVMGTSTLGNDIAAMLSLVLLFANAGAHFSLDARLRKQNGLLGRIVRSAYYEHGVPADRVLQVAKFLALYCYWCVCIYSLMMHLNEPAWMNGTAGPYLLSSNFMSRYSAEITALLAFSPWIVLMARIALWSMLPWYALIIPFILVGKIFRLYIIAWSILFFALSLFVLQLGWLAHFEFLFLFALFWQRRFMEKPQSFHVAYDDRCNLCDWTIKVIKFADIFRRVDLRPLSQNGDWLRTKGIEPADASRDLYGVDSNHGDQTHAGYDLYIALARNIFLLLPFWPFLVVGKWLRIGPVMYRFIADRRTRLFGVCELPTKKYEHLVKPTEAAVNQDLIRSNPIVIVSLHVALLSVGYLMATPAPFVGWQGLVQTPIIKTTAHAAHIYGITPIDVFNITDLRLSENWFTLSAQYTDGRTQLLPIFSEEGTRLAMHDSDRVYFGITLRLRRVVIGSDGCFFEKHQKVLKRLARYHMRPDVDGFIYTQYHQPLSPTEQILAGGYQKSAPSKVCSINFRADSTNPVAR